MPAIRWGPGWRLQPEWVPCWVALPVIFVGVGLLGRGHTTRGAWLLGGAGAWLLVTLARGCVLSRRRSPGERYVYWEEV